MCFTAIVYHVPYFLEKYRYLHDIGVAQLKRKNYDQRMAYFDSTNRYGGNTKRKFHNRFKSIEIYLANRRYLQYVAFYLFFFLKKQNNDFCVLKLKICFTKD